MRSSGWAAVAMAAVLTAAGARAEEKRVVVPSPQFKAGGFHRLVFGSGYRDLWTTQVELPLLDLQAVGGGLTPVRIVGQAQGLGLAFKGADGRAYTFRSLHKHPERMLPEEWRDQFPAKVAQDQSSHTHPAAGIILTPLQEAAGVPHTNPRLVAVPDDPALGEFRKTFAGEFGTIDEFPLAAAEGRPGFMGATEIISTSDLWTRWLAAAGNRIDSRAFLRARVIDLWLDNFDRHRGQWRWMRIPGRELYQPLPEDPDMVLVRHDGLLMRNLRSRVPKELKFGPEYTHKLEGPLSNNFEVDRWLLSGLERSAWQEVAKDLEGRFTDDVIDGALRQMPAPWYAIDGKQALAALKKRRAGLVDYVLRVYDYYARNVDVHATDEAEAVAIARAEDDSVEITIASAAGSAAPWFRRRFRPQETDDVRIYLHGGNDRVTRTGRAGGPITVRVIAGTGSNVVDDSRSGGTDVWTDGKGEVKVERGDGTHVRRNAWTNPAPVKDAPWLEPRSYGSWTVGSAVFAYHPDVELILGYGWTRTSWGFRTQPALKIQTLRGAIATGEGTGKVEYSGSFRRVGSGLSLRFETFVSDIEQFNFFGYGNDSTGEPTDKAYRAEETVLFARPTARFDLGRRFEAFIGPEVRWSDTPTTYDTIIGSTTPYGIGRFGQAALRGGLHFDSRKRPDSWSSTNITESVSSSDGGEQVSGVKLRASGFYAPKAWDVTSQYGGVDGELAGYAGSKRAHLAVRVGGRQLWGNAPWFEAAYVGGSNDRGYRSHRFIGNSSLYGSVSLRAWLFRLPIPILPTRIGVVGFVDTGRVWLENEDSSTWHTSPGGGLLFQPVMAPVTLQVTAGHSDEGTRFYFGLGYPF